MPKIAEIKVINGEVWVRIDGDILHEENEVSLYTPVELANRDRQVALAICDRIQQDYPKHHESR